jgi:hypothetical protein
MRQIAQKIKNHNKQEVWNIISDIHRRQDKNIQVNKNSIMNDIQGMFNTLCPQIISWVYNLHVFSADHPMNISAKFGSNLFCGFRKKDENVKFP